MKLKDKVILITGGASGIGQSLVKQSANKNAKVVFCDILHQQGKQLEQELLNKSKHVLFLPCDVADCNQVQQMFEQIKNKYGKLDIIINNAAKQTIASWDDMTDEEFGHIVDVNLKGVYYCMKYASKIMHDGASIINILSLYYSKPRLNKFHYDAAKAGVAQLTKEAALALGPKGISVNAIYPGYVITQMNCGQNHKKQIEKNVQKSTCLIQSKTFANAVLNCIQNFSHLTAGQIVGVDAGRSLKSDNNNI